MSNRIRYIDMSKGFAIILVILGHMMYTPSKLKVLLYIFHIPLFFFLSGYTFSVKKYTSFFVFFKKKLQTIIFPYFLMNISIFFIKSVILQPESILKVDVIYFIKALFLADRLHIYYQLWFLNVLFISELICYFVVKLCDVWYKWFSVFLTLLVLGYFGGLAYQRQYWLIWSIDLVPYATIFVLMGFIVKCNIEIVSRFLNKMYFLVAVVGAIVLGVYNYKLYGGVRVDLYYQETNSVFLYFSSAFMGIWATLIFFRNIFPLNFLERIGKNTLVYYAYHSPIVLYLIDIIMRQVIPKYSGIFGNAYVVTAFVLVCALIGCELIAYVINTSFPFMLGRISYKKCK
ncbi:acyltransferase family protein [Gemella cuniculi]|uniref:acyltransferase family protein n=1 Tax=Gemella cuniculi TaxID=150240 RepID=UPI0003FA3219|nr:acyltransferase family protein [Gemella cuniculi]